MTIEIDIPDYKDETGIAYKWEIGFYVQVCFLDGVVLIKANKSGLVSLANHMLSLSQDDVPLESHMHFDEINSLEDGSVELIIEKVG